MKGQPGVGCGSPSKVKNLLIHARSSVWAVRPSRVRRALAWKGKLVVEMGDESYTVELSQKVSI